LNVWDFANSQSSSCPQFNIDQIYVSFFCDYSNKWPWEHARRQHLPPLPPKRNRRPPANAPSNNDNLLADPLIAATSQKQSKYMKANM